MLGLRFEPQTSPNLIDLIDVLYNLKISLKFLGLIISDINFDG